MYGNSRALMYAIDVKLCYQFEDEHKLLTFSRASPKCASYSLWGCALQRITLVYDPFGPKLS